MIRNPLKITTVYLNTRFQKTTADIRQATVYTNRILMGFPPERAGQSQLTEKTALDQQS